MSKVTRRRAAVERAAAETRSKAGDNGLMVSTVIVEGENGALNVQSIVDGPTMRRALADPAFDREFRATLGSERYQAAARALSQAAYALMVMNGLVVERDGAARLRQPIELATLGPRLVAGDGRPLVAN